MKIKPEKDKISVISVQDKNVFFIESPRYWFTSQNPLSFTCEKVEAPDAIDITIRLREIGSFILSTNNGDTRLADVIIATVEEPWRTLIKTAHKKDATKISSDELKIFWANNSPIFNSIKICFNTPPAPVINIIAPAGANDFETIFSNFFLSIPSLIPRKYHAIILAIIRAEKGWPINLINSYTVSFVIISIPVSSRDLKIIRISGRSIINKTDFILGAVFIFSSSVSKTTLELKSILIN